jgi:hypothetical protein
MYGEADRMRMLNLTAFVVFLGLLPWAPSFLRAGDEMDLESVEERLAGHPDDASLLFEAGRLYLEAGNFRKSREVLEHAATVDSTNAHVFSLLGLTYAAELKEGYDGTIAEDTNKRTNLVRTMIGAMSRAVELAPDDPEIRLTRGIACVESPVFVGFMDRFDGDMAHTITREISKNAYRGYLRDAEGDLQAVLDSDAPDEMKAEAYYFLGLLHRNLGLQYWQSLTKDHPMTDASRRAWDAMRPEGAQVERVSISQDQVLVRFQLGFENDVAPQTAVWVEDDSESFVKTLYVSGFAGNVRDTQVVLPAWASASRFRTDANTGASIATGTHTLAWDLTGSAGTRVENGTYTVKVEVHHWPSLHYQLAAAKIRVGDGKGSTATVREGTLVPLLELTYVPAGG